MSAEKLTDHDRKALGIGKTYESAGIGEGQLGDNLMSEERRAELEKDKQKVAPKQKAQRTLQELIDMVQRRWEPREDRVVIYQDEAERTYKGTQIEVLNVAKPTKGTICARGPGLRGQESRMDGLEPGYRVLYGRFAGTEVELEEYGFVILRQSEIYMREKPTSE